MGRFFHQLANRDPDIFITGPKITAGSPMVAISPVQPQYLMLNHCFAYRLQKRSSGKLAHSFQKTYTTSSQPGKPRPLWSAVATSKTRRPISIRNCWPAAMIMAMIITIPIIEWLGIISSSQGILLQTLWL